MEKWLSIGGNMLGTIKGNSVVFQSKLVAIVVWVPLILILLTATIFFAWFAAEPPFPNQSLSNKALPQWVMGTIGALMFGAMSFYVGYMAIPFYLSVNLANRTYNLAIGIRPFAFYCSGSLSEIKELRVKRVNTRSSGVRFPMLLVWKQWWRAPLGFASTSDESKAYNLIQEAADILRVPPSLLLM
jgi:hypothetical protein